MMQTSCDIYIVREGRACFEWERCGYQHISSWTLYFQFHFIHCDAQNVFVDGGEGMFPRTCMFISDKMFALTVLREGHGPTSPIHAIT